MGDQLPLILIILIRSVLAPRLVLLALPVVTLTGFEPLPLVALTGFDPLSFMPCGTLFVALDFF